MHEKKVSTLTTTCCWQLLKLHFSTPKMSDFLILNWGGRLTWIKQLTDYGLYRKLIRTKDLTRRELLLQNFKVYKNKIHRLTRISKPDYYQCYFEEHKNNSKKSWDGIRSIISLKTNSDKQIKSININNKTESNPKIMAETFGNIWQLVTIDRDIDNKIIHAH